MNRDRRGWAWNGWVCFCGFSDAASFKKFSSLGQHHVTVVTYLTIVLLVVRLYQYTYLAWGLFDYNDNPLAKLLRMYQILKMLVSKHASSSVICRDNAR